MSTFADPAVTLMAPVSEFAEPVEPYSKSQDTRLVMVTRRLPLSVKAPVIIKVEATDTSKHRVSERLLMFELPRLLSVLFAPPKLNFQPEIVMLAESSNDAAALRLEAAS